MDSVERTNWCRAFHPGYIDWQGYPFNPHTLPNETLYRLIGYIEAGHVLYRRAVIAVVMLAVSAPGWFGLAAVMGIAGRTAWAAAFIAIMPGVLVLAVLAWLGVHYLTFPGIAKRTEQLEQIERELARRGRSSFTFVSDN